VCAVPAAVKYLVPVVHKFNMVKKKKKIFWKMAKKVVSKGDFNSNGLL
jgi:hypothetical protein